METLSEHVDVLIAGCGTAGAIAAIQAGRAGAKTAVIEMHGQPGGTMTTGGVCCPMYFFSRDRQVIAGIGWELAVKTMELDRLPLPDFMTPHKTRPSYGFTMNPHTFALVLEEACREADVCLHYHEIVTGVRETQGGWCIESTGKGVRRETVAKQIVDCTGDADLVGLLGLAREKSDERQPGTLMFHLSGYDPASLDADAVQQAYRAALAAGRLRTGDFWLADRQFIGFLHGGGANQQHIPGADSSTSETQSRANIEGRASLLRLLRFVKSLPGCGNARVDSMAPCAAARETYRIAGAKTITHEDYMTGRVFDDAVCYSYYFIDVHTDGGVVHEFVPEGLVPTVPLGALIPSGSRNLLVAGRCVSSDRKANSALRVEASCMAMGQAAGAAAVLAAQRGVTPGAVPLDAIKALLRAHKAITP
ncbi:FAD-dependent oxidoreductase [bacterium]|nr:FAD-dependent oxidoreductase [bacterium]